MSQESTPTAAPAPDAARKRYKQDFEFKEVIGEGSFGQVREAVELENGRRCAIKILAKEHVARENKIKYVTTERDLLDLCKHPFVVRLYYTFSDPTSLYFVLELAEGGELLTFMRRLGSFDVPTTRFYAAEIAVALQFLHENNVIHRDMKPENVLLSADYHIKLTDFGTAKRLEPSDTEAEAGADGTRMRSNSFLGTAEYVSPELLMHKYTCKSSDLWSYGCVVYQMLTGTLPFHAATDYLIFQRIQKRSIKYPDGMNPVAHDLLEAILVLEPDQRLGARAAGYDELYAHPFFEGFDFVDLWDQKAPNLGAMAPAAAPAAEAGANQRATVGGLDRAQKLEMQKESQLAQYCGVDELIIKNGMVSKKKGLSTKKRMLVLTDKPRLFYVDMQKMELKGEIPWSASIEGTVPPKNTKRFDVVTPERTYNFTDLSGEASEWVEAIALVRAAKGGGTPSPAGASAAAASGADSA